MKEINGVAFDLEGTMVNLEPGHHFAHLETARMVGIELSLEEGIERLPHLIGGSDTAVAQDIWDIMPIKIKSPNEILKKKNCLFVEYLRTAKIVPRLGLRGFLEELKTNNTPLAIGSATLRREAEIYIEKAGLRPYFEKMVILGEDVVNKKPAPDVYIATARIMKVNSEQQLVFEDSPRGVKAAVAAQSTVVGMPVYYDNPDVRESLRESGASHLFQKWEEVSIGLLQSVGIEIIGRGKFM